MSEQNKILMTAANGMQVWVPEDKLEQWQRAQADRSPEAKKRRELARSRVMSLLNRLSEEAQQR